MFKSFTKVIFVFSFCFVLAACGGNKSVFKYQEAQRYFKDPKVIELCNAASNGDTEKMEQLLTSGVDVNTVGEDGLTPLFWLFVANKETPEKKKSFKYLLENGASVSQHDSKYGWAIIHLASRYIDSGYLKMILENKSNIDLELEVNNDSSWPTPVYQALNSNRTENLQILLDHGADKEQRNNRGDTPIDMASWDEAYILLQNGADYRGGPVNLVNGKVDEQPMLIWKIENNRYWPEVAVEQYGTDWRQKVIDFLREKEGVELDPWTPEKEAKGKALSQ